MVRGAASWMDHLDERILERLNNADEPMTAWQVAYDLNSATRRRVRERCHVLAHADFVVVEKRAVLSEKYDITGEGQEYLEDEVNAEHRRPVPAPKPPGKMRPDWYAGFG